MKASLKRLLYSASCCIPERCLGTFLNFPLWAPSLNLNWDLLSANCVSFDHFRPMVARCSA